MRFYRLGAVPGALFHDEAFNGVDALALLDISLTDWPVFFEGNYGREPLFIWLSGVAHAFFSPSIWTVRFIPAISGALLVPALAWLGWQIAPLLEVRDRQLFALWCAAGTLALLWSQMFARFGVRGGLFVLVAVLLWAALWRAWQREPSALGAWVIAGVLAGLSFYTYPSARLLPLVLLPMLAVAFIEERQRLRLHLPGLFGCALAALAVAAPLGLYFLQDPDSFSGRIDRVGLDEWGSLFGNLGTALGMFVWSGDANPRHNLPLRPVLDPFLMLPFFIGLGLALHKCWRLGRTFLLAGLGVLMLPTVLSDEAPHFLRAIGALPFTVLLIAYGAEGAVRFVGRFGRKMLRPAQSLVWAAFAGATALTIWTYFVVWASSPVMFDAWEMGFSQLVRQIADEREATVYISSRRRAGHPPSKATGYLLAVEGATAQFHDGRNCLRVALTGPARYFFPPNADSLGHLPIHSYYLESPPPVPFIFDHAGEPWAVEFKKPKDWPVAFPEMRPRKVELADGIDLNGYWLSQEEIQAGESLSIRLFWQVNRTPTADYWVSLRLVRIGEDGSLERLGSFDRPPGDGSCPMTEWLPGEMVIDQSKVDLPEGLPTDDLFLAVGFYTPADGQRMLIPNAADNQIIIGPLPRSP